MKPDKRSIRRKALAKKKIKAKKIMKESWAHDEETITPRNIGRVASTHGSGCSCRMCGNPRKFFGEKTRQEYLEDLRQRDEE